MRPYRPLILTALAVAMSGGATSAADLGKGPRPMLAPPLPAFTWTGLYIGGHGGYAFGHDTTKEYFTAGMAYVGLKNTFKPEGFFGGIHIGGNLQLGSFLIGLEGDVDAGDISGGFVDPPAPPFNPGGRARTRLDLQTTFRGRLGYAFGPALLYATGGIAQGRIKSTYYNWPGIGESFTKTAVGFTIGAGVEYAFTNNLSARLEYRFTQYELFSNHSQVAFPGFTGTQEPYYHSIRAGVSYRF